VVLFWVFLHKGIPEVMTFEGRNLDIISGITAPVIYYLGFVSGRLWPRTILSWNLICLALLVNIVTTAILSTPYPFQRFGFDQPNVAIFYFPFVWLPAVIVPIVLLSHLAAIRKLIGKKKVVAQVATTSLESSRSGIILAKARRRKGRFLFAGVADGSKPIRSLRAFCNIGKSVKTL
jgi:hypothetical protein